MPDALEHNKSLGNGKDGQHNPAWSPGGLGNTDPTATLAPTGSSAPRPMPVSTKGTLGNALANLMENVRSPAGVVELWGVGSAVMMEAYSPSPVNVEQPKEATKALKPAGQVVLFRRIMEDWGFSDQDAATLLGFEAASDIGEIYLGAKSVGHRDANDRLRAILRIAADLDALFQEVAAIRGWLSEPQKDLDGKTPRSLLTEGSMENLLRVKYYVAYLSGR